jgi:hypothetical protein
MSDNQKPEKKEDGEYAASGWKNPYVLYLALMMLLFGFLVLMAYLAWTNDWIPKR